MARADAEPDCFIGAGIGENTMISPEDFAALPDNILTLWAEIAKTDDWHRVFVGSDIRMLIGQLQRARAAEALAHTSVDSRLYNALSAAVHTIESNRREIAALAPKADAYERLGRVLDLAYDRGSTRGSLVGYDPLYDIRQEMERMKQRMRGEKQATHEARQATHEARQTRQYRDSGDMTEDQILAAAGQCIDRASAAVTEYRETAQPATFEPHYGTYTGHTGSNGGSD